MAFGSSKSKSKSSASLDPQQQAALAAELVASELLMRQFLAGGSMQRNTKHLMEEQQRSAFVPSVPADMQHHSRKSKLLVSAQQSLPSAGTTHVIPPSAMTGMPPDAVYDSYHHHHQYGTHQHGYLLAEPRRRQTSDSSSSSASSLTPSPTSSTFDPNNSTPYMTYPPASEPQYGSNFGSGHRWSAKGAKGMNLKGRAMALFGH
ncbi:hypothetical protein J3R30DRAFT_574732 [Lentinula aciculospora]|uniref:Uncharacterized protein n=1 Tax=Lentinula aciculospora TaxID=153920 RepID=A0A9W9A6H7_9AGAR|nr:hypothetical protein J3R30DRAFT_574732 [Lentinula aciculospora]